MAQQEIIVKKEDSQVLEDLTSKKAALENLTLIAENNPLVHNKELYQQFLIDYEDICSKIDKHWDYLCKEYGLERKDGYDLYMDFQTSTITNKVLN